MKYLRVIFGVVLVIALFSGCKDTPIDKTTELQQGNVPQLEESVRISAQPISEKVMGYSEVSSYVGDMDGDGNDEKIVLSTSAERDGNGDFLWNDGQNWALYIESDGNTAYTLLDSFVQAGDVYFEVSDYYMESGAEPKISVITSTGAGFSVKNYSFDKTDKTYIEDVVFDTKSVTKSGINRRFSSIPHISE